MSIPFDPVPVRARCDGWTPARQAAFLAALADRRSVVGAARAVGLSWQTAYRLRARADAASFAAAWDRAAAGAGRRPCPQPRDRRHRHPDLLPRPPGRRAPPLRRPARHVAARAALPRTVRAAR